MTYNHNHCDIITVHVDFFIQSGGINEVTSR